MTVAKPTHAHARTNQLVGSSPSGSKNRNDGTTKNATTPAETSIGAASSAKRISWDREARRRQAFHENHDTAVNAQ
jgi:hypothetical protein